MVVFEKKIDSYTSAKKDGLKDKNMSDEIFNDLYSEGKIGQMIGDIENTRVGYIFQQCFDNKICSDEENMKEIDYYYNTIEPLLSDPYIEKIFNMLALVKSRPVTEESLPSRWKEELDKEIDYYHNTIEPLLSDPYVEKIFNMLALVKSRPVTEESLPSRWKEELDKEIKWKEFILNELPNLDVKTLNSLERLLPSVIMKDINWHVGMRDELLKESIKQDEKKVIANFFNKQCPDSEFVFLYKGFGGSLINEACIEKDDYAIVRNETNEDVKSLATAYVNNGYRRSDMVSTWDVLLDIAKYGKETVDYAIGLIERNYSILPPNLLHEVYKKQSS